MSLNKAYQYVGDIQQKNKKFIIKNDNIQKTYLQKGTNKLDDLPSNTFYLENMSINLDNLRQDKSTKMKAQIQQDLKQITSNQSVQNSMSYFYGNKFADTKNSQIQALNDTSKHRKDDQKQLTDVKLPNASMGKNIIKKQLEELHEVKTYKQTKDSTKFDQLFKKVQSDMQQGENQTEMMVLLLQFAQKSNLDNDYMNGKIFQILPYITDLLLTQNQRKLQMEQKLQTIQSKAMALEKNNQDLLIINEHDKKKIQKLEKQLEDKQFNQEIPRSRQIDRTKNRTKMRNDSLQEDMLLFQADESIVSEINQTSFDYVGRSQRRSDRIENEYSKMEEKLSDLNNKFGFDLRLNLGNINKK